jgi:hypothetical protein
MYGSYWLLLGGLMAACSSAKGPPRAVEYYASANLDTVPIAPEHKLKESEAVGREVYLVIERDDEGHIAKVHKLVNQKVFLSIEYTYDAGGTVQRIRTTNPEGEERVLRRASTGKFEQEAAHRDGE